MTNETTGWYSASEFLGPLSGAELSEDRFNIATSNGGMTGDFNELRVWAEVPGGKVDVVIAAESPAIFNRGAGCFPFLGMSIHQYSVPRLKTSGRLVADNNGFDVAGVTWFDRQWQHQDFHSTVPLKWAWMDINLDNGDAISLWSAFDATVGRDLAWATVLHPDGSQTVTSIEPLSKSEVDPWTSAESGNTYPTKWTVRIPQFEAVLEVVPSPRKQEIVSQMKPLNRYEGASAIHGRYKGPRRYWVRLCGAGWRLAIKTN